MSQYDQLLANEPLLVPRILREQDTLRLLKLVPTWEAFAATEAWWEMAKELSASQRKKYQAWWELLYTHMDHPKDGKAVALFFGYLTRERLKRVYSKRTEVDPAKLGIDPARARQIEEYILSRYESLNP